MPLFKHALMGGSRADAAFYRIGDTIDRIVEPFGARYIQGAAGRRIGQAQQSLPILSLIACEWKANHDRATSRRGRVATR